MKSNQWNRNAVEQPMPDILNAEGFPSFSTPAIDRALQCALTGSTSDTFYLSSEDNIDGMISAFEAVEDANILKKILVYARTNGYNRSAPICGLVVLSKKDSGAFREIAPMILRNPKDYASFIDLCRSGRIREGLGRCVKSHLKDVANNFSEYHVLKYPKNCVDIINISHPKPNGLIDYIKKGEYTDDLSQIKAYNELKKTDDPSYATKLIADYRLPFESVTSEIGRFKDPAVWTALLKVAPTMNLLRNLNTFQRHDVFKSSDNRSYVVSKLTNADSIHKSMIYPFQFYIALNNLVDAPEMGMIHDALTVAMRLSVDNIPTTDEKLAIMSDVSCSMSSNVMGKKSVLQCIDLVSLFTAVVWEKCETKPIVIPFSERVIKEWMGETYNNLPFMDKVELFKPLGGTNMSAPLEYMINNRVFVDKIVAFTDNMEWEGYGFMDMYKAYKTYINPNVKAVLVTLLPYEGRPTPVNYNGVKYVYGWSDKVLEIVTRKNNVQMKDVEQYYSNQIIENTE